MDRPHFIAAIPVSATAEVRVSLERVRDRDVIDLRTFEDFRTGCATVRGPTKAGISIAPAALPELIRALQAARAEAERRGLI